MASPNSFVNQMGVKSQNTGAGSSSAHAGDAIQITTGGVNQVLTSSDATTIVMNNTVGAADLHLPVQAVSTGTTIIVQSVTNATTVKKSVADGSGPVGAAAGVLAVGKMSWFTCPPTGGWIQIYLQA
jgi:hypothetical protein